jgi:RNA polymerase sigma factor (sigma-70 family)
MKDHKEPFEEVLYNFMPLIKAQIRALRIYKDYENYFQVGMIALWDAYRNFDSTKGSFSNYAYHTVRGKLKTELRKQSNVQQHEKMKEDIILGHYEETYLQSEMVQALLQQLTTKQRKWFYYAIIEHMTPSEIALQEGVSTEAVKSWRRQALRKLKKQYKQLET